MSAQYLRTDERDDLLASLKLVCVSARECQRDIQFWKWILVGTHSSLQAAIVFHLSFGNNLLVAKPKYAKKWLEAHRTEGNYPNMQMDFFLELYEKAKAQEVLGFRLATQASQDESVEMLVTLRNEFVHFMPKGWAIELAGLPGICLNALGVIELLLRGPMQKRWENEAQTANVQGLLAECRVLIQERHMAYQAV